MFSGVSIASKIARVKAIPEKDMTTNMPPKSTT